MEYIGLFIILENMLVLAIIIYLMIKLNKLRASNQQLQNDKQAALDRVVECNKSFNEVFNINSDGIALLNLELNFFKANQTLCMLLGYSMEKILTWNLKTIFVGNFEGEHQVGVNKLLLKQINAYTYQQKFIKKNGDAIGVIITLYVVSDKQNEPNYFIMHLKANNR